MITVYRPPLVGGVAYAAEVGEIQEICFDAAKGWICTLKKTHPGNHKALDIEYRLCAEWSQ